MKKKMIICLVLVLCFGCIVSASLVSIETYEDWLYEIGPEGHITVAQSYDPFWDNEYPDPLIDHSSEFVIPTISAVPDQEGEPALIMDFGEGILGDPFIGAVVYTFSESGVPDPEPPRSLSHGKISFSVQKIGTEHTPNEWNWWSVQLKDANGKNVVWIGNIKKRETVGDAWENIEIDIDNLPPKQIDTGFDVTKVVNVWFDYRGIWDEEKTKGMLDHVVITPEPATLSLLALGSLVVFRRRKF